MYRLARADSEPSMRFGPVGRWGAIAACLAWALPAIGQTPVPIPLCRSIPNGSIQNGFTNWAIAPSEGGFGNYSTFTNASIVDLTPIGDIHVAALDIYASAEWDAGYPSGSGAQSQEVLATSAVVSGRYLRFRAGGGFFFTIFAHGQVSYDALVRVTNQNGVVVECPIVRGRFTGDIDCPSGLIADGYMPYEFYCCDLRNPLGTTPGIQVGDTVRIEVYWSAATIAVNNCDYSDFGGTLFVDQFQFCSACLQISPDPGSIGGQTAPDSSPGSLPVVGAEGVSGARNSAIPTRAVTRAVENRDETASFIGRDDFVAIGAWYRERALNESQATPDMQKPINTTSNGDGVASPKPKTSQE